MGFDASFLDGLVVQSELPAEANGLLEVVAANLVVLFAEAALREPLRETLMVCGTATQGSGFVRGIVDERVPEGEAVLAGDHRGGRLEELAPDEPEQGRSECFVALAERGDCTRPEVLADNRGAFEHVSLGRLEPVEPGGEEGLDRRRQLGELVPPISASIATSCSA